MANQLQLKTWVKEEHTYTLTNWYYKHNQKWNILKTCSVETVATAPQQQDRINRVSLYSYKHILFKLYYRVVHSHTINQVIRKNFEIRVVKLCWSNAIGSLKSKKKPAIRTSI